MKSTAAARQITDPSRINPSIKAACVHTHVHARTIPELLKKRFFLMALRGNGEKQFSFINLVTQNMYIIKINAITFTVNNNPNFSIIGHLEVFNYCP